MGFDNYKCQMHIYRGYDDCLERSLMSGGATARRLVATGEELRDDEVLRSLREASARWIRQERARPRLASGVAELDRWLKGGWPSGKIGELVGELSTGCSGTAMATVAAATIRGEVVAWIDPVDAFDPASARARGVDLRRVLWVRPRGEEDAVRAAELVLEVGGFTVVVLDLGKGHRAQGTGRRGGRRRGPLRLRLARAVERVGAVVLVLAERPWAGTLAGVTLRFERRGAQWGGEAGSSRWLAGLGSGLRAQGSGEEVCDLRSWGRAG
jgi:hypothetical protein